MDFVSHTLHDGIARIRLLDGEHGNSLHAESVGQLRAAVHRCHEQSPRVVLLTASGRHFCVGGDAARFAQIADVAPYLEQLADDIAGLISDLASSRSLVVAAVQGAAAGAGFALAAAADIIVAGPRAKFLVGYTRSGLALGGGLDALADTIGVHRMLSAAVLGDAITAEEAQTTGLVARLVEEPELESTAERLATQVADLDPAAVASAKLALRRR